MADVFKAPLRLPEKYRDLEPVFNTLQREIIAAVEAMADSAQTAATAAQTTANTAQATANTAVSSAGVANSGIRDINFIGWNLL